jgi:hypothetical protein
MVVLSEDERSRQDVAALRVVDVPIPARLGAGRVGEMDQGARLLVGKLAHPRERGTGRAAGTSTGGVADA